MTQAFHPPWQPALTNPIPALAPELGLDWTFETLIGVNSIQFPRIPFPLHPERSLALQDYPFPPGISLFLISPI